MVRRNNVSRQWLASKTRIFKFLQGKTKLSCLKHYGEICKRVFFITIFWMIKLFVYLPNASFSQGFIFGRKV